MELLSNYYNTERPAFIRRANDTREFEPFWNQLGEIISVASPEEHKGEPEF
jgi:hypothetical protein